MKYNNKKTEIDGILFDSEMESKYYRYLQEQQKNGNVIHIQLQPVYELLPTFRKNKRTIRPMKYKADYLVEYADGHKELIDIKTEATMTPAFRLKWKLFDYTYPDLELMLLTLHKGEWMELKDKPKGTTPKAKAKTDAKRSTAKKRRSVSSKTRR